MKLDDFVRERKDLLSVAEAALEEAKKQRADACKVGVTSSINRRLVVEGKELSLADTVESQKFAVVVHKDQKKGSASVNATQPEILKQSVTDALEIARFSVPDPYLAMAKSSEAPMAQELGFLFDEELFSLELDGLAKIFKPVLAALTEDPRVALDRCEFSVHLAFQSLLNSHGVRQSEQQTSIHWSFFGMARDGEQVTGFDYDGNFSFKQKDVLSKAQADAARFAAGLVRQLNPRSAPTYKGPVLFTPRAVEEILLGQILYHVGGSQVMDGKSRWEKMKNRQVVHTSLTLVDHPHDSRFMGATAYDGDGIPTSERTVIEKGVLTDFLFDVYSAHRMGRQSNGCAGAPFALEVRPGHTLLQDMMKMRKELLLVDRFSGNTDPVKGDFSGVAKNSRLLESGSDVAAVTETMIAGNIFDLLSNVLAVSKEQFLVSGQVLCPYVLVDNVSVSGS